MHALEEQHDRGMNYTSEHPASRVKKGFLSDEANEKYNNLLKWSGTGGGERTPKAAPAQPAAPTSGPEIGARKKFKQGWGVWDGTDYVPE